MPKFEVTALSHDGLSGEGPFIYDCADHEAALAKYMAWSTKTGGEPFPRLSVEGVRGDTPA